MYVTLLLGNSLTSLFFSRLLKVASSLPSLPFLMSLVLVPLRAPFTASRHWNMAPNLSEEPLPGKEARRIWAYQSLIL